MQSFTRGATATARRLRLQSRLQQRRWASHESHAQPQQHAPAPRNESFGSGFFIALLGVPAALAIYTLSRPGEKGEQPYFSRLITSIYASYAKSNEERNTLHTDAIEQAASDRTLFLNENSLNKRYIHVKFPEQLNGGSPYNVPAGRGHANMDELIAKYNKEAYEANEVKLQQLKDNKVPAEQPFVSKFTKVTPATADS